MVISLAVVSALSVLALGLSAFTLFRARQDLAEQAIRQIRDIQGQVVQLSQTDFPQLAAHVSAQVDLAQDLLDRAEQKRRRVAAQTQRERRSAAVGPGNGGGPPWMDPSLPEAERRAALRAATRGL